MTQKEELQLVVPRMNVDHSYSQTSNEDGWLLFGFLAGPQKKTRIKLLTLLPGARVKLYEAICWHKRTT